MDENWRLQRERESMYLQMILVSAVVALASGVAAAQGAVKTAFDDDGMITVNGARTFIIGSYAAAKSDQPYAELAEAGFNLVNANPDTAAAAAAAGLMCWIGVGTLDLNDREASTAKLIEAVNRAKTAPGLAFLETVDEPAWSWMKAEARIPWQAFAEAYPLIKQADPDHLLYLNQAPTNLVKTLREYNAGTDIVACDIYPVNPGGLKHSFALFQDGYQGDLNNEHISQVGEYTDKMRQVTGPNRPLLMVLQAFAWEAIAEDTGGVAERREEKILYPTRAQTRFMAFQSIIKGANGIIYWGSHTMPQPSQAWSDIKSVAREVADLAPVLAGRAVEAPVEIDYQEVGHSVDDGVQFLVKDGGDKRFVFTCNADKNRCRATLAGLGGWTSCTVLNENRTLPVENGSITDDWRRFEVHVYELSR